MTPRQIITPPSPRVDGDDVPFAWAEKPRPRPHPLTIAFAALISIATIAAICGLTVTGARIVAGWVLQ